MTEIETGLQRLGILEVVRDTLRNPDATATDIVVAVQMHLKHRSIPAPTAPEVFNEKKDSVCAILECRSEGLAIEVAKFLQGDVETTAAIALAVWGAFTGISTILHGKFVYAAGHGRLSAVYDALFKWVTMEHTKVALVGVVPGTLPASVYDYEALQNDLRFPATGSTGCRVLDSLVNVYLNTCPVKSYTAEFLKPIAYVCQLTDYTQGAPEWWVSQLLENVPEEESDILHCSAMLQERSKEYVERLTLPQTEVNKNYPARVIQHLVYYNQMCRATMGKNDRASAITNMSLG